MEVLGSVLEISTQSHRFTLPLIPVSYQGDPPLPVELPQVSPVVSSSSATGRFEIQYPFQIGAVGDLPGSTEGSADLVYSTFLGGSSWDTGYSIKTDSSGNSYVVGSTPSADFPITPGALDPSVSQIDIFVARLNPSGSSLGYATYLGGSGFDYGYGLDVIAGEAYITGDSLSPNFPVTQDAYDASCGTDGTCNSGGQGPYADAILTRLNLTGTALIYSTFIGGSDEDSSNSIDVEGNYAYLAGITWSADFPASGAKGSGDAFIVKMGVPGPLSYSKLLAGSDTEVGYGISVTQGLAYVTGETLSSDFPASGFMGGRDVFVAKLDSSGGISFNKLIGNSGDESGRAIALDGNQNIYLTGSTSSSGFPVTEGSYAGGTDAFLVSLTQAAVLIYSTMLGGSDFDEARGVALDAQSGINLTGFTNSTNFPVTADAYQTGLSGSTDAFVTRFDLASTNPNHIFYSSYIGGSDRDRGYSIAADNSGISYITGYTTSSNFPTTGSAFDRTLNGDWDAFILKLVAGPIPAIVLQKNTNGQDSNSPPGVYLPINSTVNWTYTVTNAGKTSLSSVIVSDNKGVPVTCPKSNLSIGESMICMATGIVVSGQYTNIGSVTANSTNGTVSANDPANYFGADPRILLVKKVNGVDANHPTGPVPAAGGCHHLELHRHQPGQRGAEPMSRLRMTTAHRPTRLTISRFADRSTWPAAPTRSARAAGVAEPDNTSTSPPPTARRLAAWQMSATPTQPLFRRHAGPDPAEKDPGAGCQCILLVRTFAWATRSTGLMKRRTPAM